MRRIALLRTLVVAGLALIMPASASADRFVGYVGGVASGKGHHFVVGNGLNLVFRDFRRSYTPYRVCWRRVDSNHRRCWRRVTGRSAHRDRIFTAAPSRAGRYLVKWRVHGRVVARWRFHNGVGD